MARIRTIKPEFFQHEELFEAEAASGLPLRLAFVGLWTVADKAGRFEWRPRQLKLNVLPYDEVDFPAVLSALEAGGFIVRYVAEGKSYGFIPSWLKHQHINVREPSSTIPAPDGDGCDTVPVPDEAGTDTGQVPDQAAGKGREGKGTGKGKEREDASATRGSSVVDGLNLEAWEAWCDYRKAIGKPIRPVSMPAAQRKLAGFGASQAAAVEQSIANGWQGLFEPKRSGLNGLKPALRLRTADEIEAEEAARGRQSAA